MYKVVHVHEDETEEHVQWFSFRYEAEQRARKLQPKLKGSEKIAVRDCYASAPTVKRCIEDLLNGKGVDCDILVLSAPWGSGRRNRKMVIVGLKGGAT